MHQQSAVSSQQSAVLSLSGDSYQLRYLQEFMTICKNLTDEQVKAAFEQFDTSGDDKLDYRQTCKRWLTIYIDNYGLPEVLGPSGARLIV